MEKQINDLRQIRADLDLLLVLSSQISGSREGSLAITKLQEGKMHIGNAISQISDVKVYAESKNPSNETIEAYHVDKQIVAMSTPNDWFGTEVSKVKILRRELDKMFDRIKAVTVENDYVVSLSVESMYASFFCMESLVRVKESCNWYGMVLGNIRDKEDAKLSPLTFKNSA